MHLDPWTFALQIVNVLVLVWLLARFLFRPVAAIIAERRAAADALLAQAEAARAKAAARRPRCNAQRDGCPGKPTASSPRRVRRPKQNVRRCCARRTRPPRGCRRMPPRRSTATAHAMRAALEHEADRTRGRDCPAAAAERCRRQALTPGLPRRTGRRPWPRIRHAPCSRTKRWNSAARSRSMPRRRPTCRDLLADALGAEPQLSFSADPTPDRRHRAHRAARGDPHCPGAPISIASRNFCWPTTSMTQHPSPWLEAARARVAAADLCARRDRGRPRRTASATASP